MPYCPIVATLGYVLAKGAKVGAVLNAIIVAVKLATIFLFIGVAAFHVDPTLWHPFIPPEVIDADGAKHFGWGGVFDMQGFYTLLNIENVVGSDFADNITGNVSASADLHIDGRVEGDVTCTSLVQGESGEIVGAVKAESARLAGTVRGTISVRELVVLKSARIYGDVQFGYVDRSAGF